MSYASRLVRFEGSPVYRDQRSQLLHRRDGAAVDKDRDALEDIAQESARIHRELPPRLTFGTGIASGLMNGAFAIPGPPVVVYAMAVIPEAASARAFLMAFFYASNVLGVVMFSIAGMVTLTPLLLLVLAFPLTLLGDKTGIALFHRFGSGSYRPVALVVALCLGCWNVYSGLS